MASADREMTPEQEGKPAEVIPLVRWTNSQLNNAVGMFLFLASWGITFAGLFVAYAILRLRAHVWPPPGTPNLPKLLPEINTLIAVASSLTFDLAVRSARMARPGLVRRWLLVTGILSTVFLVLQTIVWTNLRAHGLVLGATNFAGMYYALTWFHAAHVAVGIVIMLALTPRALRDGFTPRDHGPLRFSAWFWHFVTVVWFGVFLSFYVL